MTNAVRYSGERGKKVFLSAYRNGKDIILEVRDEGVGIPQEDIRRVFEPFYTGKNGRTFGESTGMGLYIVSKICDYLGHSVKLDSEVGKERRLKSSSTTRKSSSRTCGEGDRSMIVTYASKMYENYSHTFLQ